MDPIRTRRELLREKIHHLVAYCCQLKPERSTEIMVLAQLPDEEIIYWIVHQILPHQANLLPFVESFLRYHQIEPTPEITEKLIRYCKFFILFMEK